MSNFRMLTTKNTLNSAFFDAHPTLTGGELTKSGVKPPVITPKKFHDTTKKVPNRCFFLPKNSQFSGSKKALITDTEEE